MLFLFVICFVFLLVCFWCFFFFFQAEDGIRDKLVTGVQTCALPISVIGIVVVHPDPRDKSDGTLWDALNTAIRGRLGAAGRRPDVAGLVDDSLRPAARP